MPNNNCVERNFRVEFFVAFFLLLFTLKTFACQCPPTQLSKEECNKYGIIFKGKIVTLKNCGEKLGEAIFSVEELYKGNTGSEFKVMFDCAGECAQKLNVGDEWIIYSNYRQIDNAMLDWCSRSRKYFKIEKLDFYTVNYGNDYDDELKFLRETLGAHRLLADNKNKIEGRNIRPDTTQTVVILLCSLMAIVLFYYLFNRFFR